MFEQLDSENLENIENLQQEAPVDITLPPSTLPTKTPKRQMTFSILESGVIQASFGKDVEPVQFSPAEIPESLKSQALLEGIISRTRSYTSALDGAERTPASLRERIILAFDNLRKGIWHVQRGEGGTSISLEEESAWVFRKLRALSKGEDFTQSLEDCTAEWAALTEKQREIAKATPRYQQAKAQVQAERTAKRAAVLAAKADEAEENSPF